MSDDEDDFQYYGTLLEPYEEDEVPKKKAFSIEDQVATDDQGRRRFHGAFTGGFSAGFFNTVGSLEGWKPSEFKSSRSEKAENKQQKPQDFMDDEDVGQFGIAPSVVRATSDFSNIEKRKRNLKHDGPIPGVPVLHSILQPAKETIGIRLLKKMGWKPGQGVGPRITKKEKKKQNLENNSGKIYGCEIPEEFRRPIPEDDSSSDEDIEVTFAPDDYDIFLCKPKDNQFGMGYSGLDKRPVLTSHINLFGPSEFKMQDHKNNKISISGQAFGVGAFEHEDEDIYAGEDMSKYDFELGASKNKNRKPKKQEKIKESDIIEGFILAQNPVAIKKSFPVPTLPKNFIPKHGVRISRFEPLPENHKMFNYNRKMGRHDLTSQQRSKILNFTPEIITSEQNKMAENIDKEKEIIKEKAAKITQALGETQLGPFKPFVTNPEKQKRYEQYLSFKKNHQEEKLSDIQPVSMSETEKEHEKYEFAQASRMFKPVAGLVFDKFVTASSQDESTDPLKPVGRSVYEHGTKEMREAAQKKMFGVLTRSIEVWVPNKLLCRRFNVPDPDISETEKTLSKKRKNKYSVFDYYEAYQQNKTIPIGPEPRKETEEKLQETPAVPPEEINPNLAKYITPNDKIIPEEIVSSSSNIVPNKEINIPSTSSSNPLIEFLPKRFQQTSVEKNPVTELPTDPKEKIIVPIKETNISSSSSNPLIEFLPKRFQQTSAEKNSVTELPTDPKEKFIVPNKEINTPSTSSSNPLIEFVPKRFQITSVEKNPVTELPTDPKEKLDLFKAIFLSSSDESENEEKEQSKTEEKIIEMKKIILEQKELPTSNSDSIPKANKGIFADLDWSQINRKNNKVEQKKEENNQQIDENLFGPKLPEKVAKQPTMASPWKPMFVNKQSEDSSSSDDEWTEVDSSADKSSKKKHKKHKSKSKKHKSKHKKKKHSSRH